MLNNYRSLIAPLLSLFIFTLGNGFLTTLITVRLYHEGNSDFFIGIMSTAFFTGLFLGSFNAEKFIIRVGHIRAFSAFASAIAAITIIQGMYYNAYGWILIRLFGGYCLAGLFVVIESWLLAIGTRTTRGTIIAFYMIAYYGAQAFGQLLLIFFKETKGLEGFALIAMLASLSVIPLSITKQRSPIIEEPSALGLKVLLKKTSSAMFGSVTAGMIAGGIYGLLPKYFAAEFVTNFYVSIFMFITIFGGMALQYPIGKLSDFIDRRLVFIFVNIALICASSVILFIHENTYLIALNMLILGGFGFSMYSIAISHACDVLDNKDIVAGTQTLVLTNSFGAMIGPLIAGKLMDFSENGIFFFFISIAALNVCFFMYRRHTKDSVKQGEQFYSFPDTTPFIAELDPRSDEDIETSINN